jgi:HTH-type transcriptional regulator, sugar sensing transcriptional regulator
LQFAGHMVDWSSSNHNYFCNYLTFMAKIQAIARRGARPDAPKAPLADALQQLGFTDYEARTYLALIDASPATAYEVANATSLPRANVYTVLRALEAKGAIQPVSEEPLRYAPVNPEEFFARVEKSTAELCRHVVKQMERKAPSQNDVYVRVARGRRQVVAKISDLLAQARNEVWIKAAPQLLEPVLAQVREVADRGVKVKLILFGSPPEPLRSHPHVTVFAHEGEGTPRAVSDLLFTMTVDLDGVLIASFTGDATGSYTRNPSIIYVMQVYLLHEMYLADIYAVLGDDLDRHFGKDLSKLRAKYRPHNMERYVIEATERRRPVDGAKPDEAGFDRP